MVANDNWRSAARGCLTTALSRLDELATNSDDVKQLLDIVKVVAEVAGTAEMLENERRGKSNGDDTDE